MTGYRVVDLAATDTIFALCLSSFLSSISDMLRNSFPLCQKNFSINLCSPLFFSCAKLSNLIPNNATQLEVCAQALQMWLIFEAVFLATT